MANQAITNINFSIEPSFKAHWLFCLTILTPISYGFLGISLLCSLAFYSENCFGESKFPLHGLVYEWTNNSPLYHSQNQFAGKYGTYLLGFRHSLNPEWVVGWSINFRSFHRKHTGQELAFLSFNHETLYKIRLYEPTYLLTGPKISYLRPTQQSRFPLVKDTKAETGIAAGLVLSLYHRLTQKWAVNFRMERWRGTTTNQVHALETGIGLVYSLKE